MHWLVDLYLRPLICGLPTTLSKDLVNAYSWYCPEVVCGVSVPILHVEILYPVLPLLVVFVYFAC